MRVLSYQVLSGRIYKTYACLHVCDLELYLNLTVITKFTVLDICEKLSMEKNKRARA